MAIKHTALVTTLVGLLLAGGGIMTAFTMLAQPIESRWWPTAGGIVVNASVKHISSMRGDRYRPDVLYRYTVDGKSYESGRLSFTTRSYDKERAAKRVMRDGGYKKGADVVVFYDPDRPATAVLVPGSGLVVPFSIGLATLLGLVILGIGVALWRERESAAAETGALGPFAPSVFDDPLAEQLDWKHKGNLVQAAFRTRRLVRVSPHRLEFRETGGVRFTYIAIGCVAVAANVALPATLIMGSQSTDGPSELPTSILRALSLIGVLFGVTAVLIWYLVGRRTVIDTKAGEMWNGTRGHAGSDHQPFPCQLRRLQDAHAVQIVADYARRKSADPSGGDPHAGEDSIASCGLNLVFADGSARRLTNQPDLAETRDHAAAIAALLSCPVWDRTLYA